jgi:transposase-like protein
MIFLDDELARREACDEFKRQCVLRALERNYWNVSRPARELGVHRSTVLATPTLWGVRRPGGAHERTASP